MIHENAVMTDLLWTRYRPGRRPQNIDKIKIRA